MKSKVSIIIPVYNGSNFLYEAIESALSQTYKNIEVIVINDGSDDNGQTEKIALSFKSKILYIKKSRGGVASALNLGVRHMTGQYFSWLSHDDIYEKNKIEVQMKMLSNMHNDNVVVYSNYTIFTDKKSKSVLMRMNAIPNNTFRYWITVENTLHGCTLLIPKSAFLKHGYFKESLKTTQDYDMWFRLAKFYTFIFIDAPLVKSRMHDEQSSVLYKKLCLQECDELMAKFVSKLSSREVNFDGKQPLYLGYAHIASKMFYRGYFRSAILSYRLSKSKLKEKSLFSTLKIQGAIFRGITLYFFVKPFRKILPPLIRTGLKKSIKYIRQTDLC